MKQTLTCMSAVLTGVSVLCILAGCLGQTHTIVVDAQTAQLEFGVVAVQLEVGNGEIVDFCVVLNDSICGFPGAEVLGCGLDVPAGQVNVLCADPILAQWPNTWNLVSATWSAPSVPASGNVLVEPAFGYVLPSGSAIITDPGYSAYIMRLDLDADFGPAAVDFSLLFDHGGDTDVVLKAVEVIVADHQSFPDLKILVPMGDPVVDFPNLPPENVIDVGASLAVKKKTWGLWKSLFQ